jgi:hypothetical protein
MPQLGVLSAHVCALLNGTASTNASAAALVRAIDDDRAQAAVTIVGRTSDNSAVHRP